MVSPECLESLARKETEETMECPVCPESKVYLDFPHQPTFWSLASQVCQVWMALRVLQVIWDPWDLRVSAAKMECQDCLE